MSDASSAMHNKEILIFEDSDLLVKSAINKWTAMAENAISKKGFFTVALSGGSTPVTLYKELARTDLRWDKTHIFMVDERYVPPDHIDSNFRMINETLLHNITIPGQNLHAVPTANDSAADSARSYEQDIISFFKLSSGDTPEFDLVLLGLGNDGHTASLFPGSDVLNEKERLAVSAMPPAKAGHERITITFPVINNARNIIFLVTGSGKAVVVKDVLENEYSAVPAAIVIPYTGSLTFMLDRQAGSLLSGENR